MGNFSIQFFRKSMTSYLHRAILIQKLFFWLCTAATLIQPFDTANALEFELRQIAEEQYLNREPVISAEGLVAWYVLEKNDDQQAKSEIYVHYDGKTRPLTQNNMHLNSGNFRPKVFNDSVVFQTTYDETETMMKQKRSWILKEVPDKTKGEFPELDAGYQAHSEADGDAGFRGRQWFTRASTNIDTEAQSADSIKAAEPVRYPSGRNEICTWKIGGEIKRITSDGRNDLAPSIGNGVVAWQKSKGFPFGWEIMVLAGEERYQLTTNYYYDMAPQVYEDKVTWYGWDGKDYEIWLHDRAAKKTIQITNNDYDDVSPQISGLNLTWEGYRNVESDIFLWTGGKTKILSDNSEADINPRIWQDKVVWQGYDGDDFEIFYYDGEKPAKLTSNGFDDYSPDINDGMIVWMGYHDNWDAEIFAFDGTDLIQVTDNDQEDRDPKTAGKKIVWQAEHEGKTSIFLGIPK